jgi:hypothetical protein
MGACLILTPLIIASWPAVTAAVTAAVSSMGFSLAQGNNAERQQAQAASRVEMAVEDSEILKEGGATSERLVVERDGVRAIFSRDARGALKLCMEAKGRSESELRQLGDELIGRVTQQYAYHRIVTELKKRNMTVVDEQVTQNQTVKIRVRSV